ncbi:MAG: AmmeMemoRadiSam system protein B, partial [Elusimicrobia bacterium]|nr:AmmeMemoRadiSam system protein B [Elusimicrobiota bacterium]
MKKLLTILAAAALPALGGTRRIPAVAGRFYPSNPRSLGALVSRELAAAPVVVLPPKARIVALLVPHAGLAYSGRIAARAFKLLRRGRFDHVVIVGTCHYKELAGAALYPGDYGVPGAYLPFDSALAAALMKATPLIREDAAAHRKEHSIEVEVPFLRRMLGGVPTTALVMNTEDLDTARAVGLALARVCRNRRVLLVASSDLSHYPSGGVADAVDATTLAALSSLDPAYFWLTNRFLMSRAIPDLAVTYCGEGAVTAVLTAARELGANRLRVLGRINSGDVVP